MIENNEHDGPANPTPEPSIDEQFAAQGDAPVNAEVVTENAVATSNAFQTRRGERRIKVALTNEEVCELAQDLARRTNELTALENEKKEFSASIGARIAECKAAAAKLALALAQGGDWRAVPVREVFDFNEGTVRAYRLTSDELLDERPLTDADRQLSML